ncbi:PLDc N-terminal domain-containing protein [Luethyella okanaganae]|uniref:PLDc N-terminal domain-containing protein n=1 Tax=Luethyella okanaganae TaxID=69372 RepID=A0ABW1VG20_9MICO
MNISDVLPLLLILLGGIAAVAWLVFIVIAAVQVVRSTTIQYWSKVLWVAALIIFPFLGVVAWYAFGDRTRQVENAIATHLR